MKYIPQPVRRVYIPKTNKGERPLGIPAVEDKIVQMALKRILEAIYEVDFLDVSYGFRPNRSCHQALRMVRVAIAKYPTGCVVDMDIEKFFDTVDHKWLIEMLKVRIADPNIIRLIVQMLKAGVMEDGKYYETEKGTPQGGILSPLLANIYLHYGLDLWFEKVEKKRHKGYAKLIRYADDFIICLEYKDETIVERIKERLGKFGLKISEEKSRIIEFGRRPFNEAQKRGESLQSFDFLGFTHRCVKNGKGNFKLAQETAKKKFRQGVMELGKWLKNIRNQVELKVWWKIFIQKIMGHFNYYGISGNYNKLVEFYREVRKLAFKWINRRSQRRSYNWEQFQRFLDHNPLPKPKIYHITYALS